MKKGQALLLTILALGGAILGATTIAGVLTLYQIRATTDTENSAKAIFAADAGVEWALFDYYCDAPSPSRCDPLAREQQMPGTPSSTQGVSMLPNGTVVTVLCTDVSDNPTLCSNTSTAVSAVSKGFSVTSVRAFLVDLAGGTTTVP